MRLITSEYGTRLPTQHHIQPDRQTCVVQGSCVCVSVCTCYSHSVQSDDTMHFMHNVQQ